MNSRRQTIERILRQIYGDLPTDDSVITYPLVNLWINDALGIAAKKCYTDSLQLDGVAYVNNSFYSTFKGIAVSKDEEGIYKFTLPQIPISLGRNEGIASVKFKKSILVSIDAIPLSISQVSTQKNLRVIPNKLQYWSEGKFCYVWSLIDLTKCTATVRMVSGGDSTDLDSTLLIPDDYMQIVVEYIKAQLAFERQQPQDTSNNGNDSK